MAQPALRVGFGVKSTFKNECNQAIPFLFIVWVLSSFKDLKEIGEGRAGLHSFLNVLLTPNPTLRAGWAMGNLFHLNELGQNQGRPPTDYPSP